MSTGGAGAAVPEGGHAGRPAGAARLGRRPTDRAEDALAWALAAAALLVLLAAVLLGWTAAADGAARAARDAVHVTPVRAVLLEATPLNDGPGAWAAPALVPARLVGAPGGERVVPVPVRGYAVAGTEVPAWVDRAGAVVPEPRTAGDAAWGGVVVAVTVLALGWLVVGAAWSGTRAVLLRCNAAAWEREWAAVEPVWSGRRDA